MRAIPLIVFLVLAAGMAVMLLQKNAMKPGGEAALKPLPALTLNTFDGKKSWSAEQLKGKVTLINFFASWCLPCAAEMPELVALKKQFPALQVEGVAWNDQADAMQKFLQKYGNPYQHLWFDEKGDATINLGIRGIPESILVDSAGMVRYRLAGPLTPELRAGEVGMLIAQLLKESPHAAP